MVGNEYRTQLKVKRDTRRVEIGYIVFARKIGAGPDRGGIQGDFGRFGLL